MLNQFVYTVAGELYARIDLRVEQTESGAFQLVDCTGWDGFNETEPAVLLEGSDQSVIEKMAAVWVDDAENGTITFFKKPCGNYAVSYGAVNELINGGVTRGRYRFQVPLSDNGYFPKGGSSKYQTRRIGHAYPSGCFCFTRLYGAEDSWLQAML